MQEFHRIKKLNENLYQKRFSSIRELEKIVDETSGQKNLLIVTIEGSDEKFICCTQDVCFHAAEDSAELFVFYTLNEYFSDGDFSYVFDPEYIVDINYIQAGFSAPGVFYDLQNIIPVGLVQEIAEDKAPVNCPDCKIVIDFDDLVCPNCIDNRRFRDQSLFSGRFAR